MLMEWVDGVALHRYVQSNLGRTNAMTALASSWADLVSTLHRQRIAHGDLEHGNLLFSRAGQLRLVDLDSIWLPSFTAPANETGHPSYQHPARSRSDWGPNIDGFSVLALTTSILALQHNPELWQTFHSGNNLIFSKESYLNRQHPLWLSLLETGGRVATLAEVVREWIDHPVDWLTLDDVVRITS
jgi:serine/threonine protein kinase